MRMRGRSSFSTTAISSGCWRSSRGAPATPSWRPTSRRRPSRPRSSHVGATAEGGAASSWLFGIAYHKLADSQRQGFADDRARRRVGIERIELTDDDIARIDRLGETDVVAQLVGELPTDQQEAIRARVVEERGVRRDREGAADLRDRGAQTGQPRPCSPAPPDGRTGLMADSTSRKGSAWN